MRRIFFLVGVLIATLLAPATATAAQNFTINFSDHFSSGTVQSMITSSKQMASMMGNGYYLCSSLDDPKCSQAADITAILPMCSGSTDAYCIESLNITSNKSTAGAATVLKTIGKKQFSADAAKGLPEGSHETLFEVPGLKTAGEQSLYAVRVKVDLVSFPGVGVIATDFSASVVPYENSTTSSSDPEVRESVDPQGKTSVGVFVSDTNNTCVWIENGACGKETKFPDGAKVTLTLHMANYLTTWMHGRLTEQSITLSQLTPKQNRIVVQAKPLEIQGSSITLSTDKVDPAMLNNFRDANGFLHEGDISQMVETSQDGTLPYFKGFETDLGDKSKTLTSTWSFRSLSGSMLSDPSMALAVMTNNTAALSSALSAAIVKNSGLGSMASACLPQASTLAGAILGQNSITDLIGLVTTSAMVYGAGPPTFKDGALDYQVAGLHFNPDGTVFSGRYDLLMNKTIAKCMYGFGPNVPVYADVQLVNSDGTARVTTAILSEDANWLKLGVYGITFSSPTVRIKLREVGSTTPTPSASASPSPSATKVAVAKKSTITCTKAKVMKRVTAVNPKCPNGYKLKK